MNVTLTIHHEPTTQEILLGAFGMNSPLPIGITDPLSIDDIGATAHPFIHAGNFEAHSPQEKCAKHEQKRVYPNE